MRSNFHHTRRAKIRGFTLLELLVSIVIGGIVLAGALSTYGVFSQTTARIRQTQQLHQAVNFAMIRMADRMRAYSIGYEQYGNFLPGKTSNQVFFGDGTHLHFSKNQLYLNEQPLFAPPFVVTDAVFTVTPAQDPFSATKLSADSYRQPRLTIKLQVASKQNPTITTTVRTTISSRLYQ